MNNVIKRQRWVVSTLLGMDLQLLYTVNSICKNYRPQVKQSELEYRLSHLLTCTCLHNMKYQQY